MPPTRRSSLAFHPSLSLILLSILLGTLCLAGGASTPDVLGQGVVRSVTWLLLLIAVLFVRRPSIGRAKPVLALLVSAAVLALLQLLPLPPVIWQSLPGRSVLADALSSSGQPQPWRPWANVPGATLNAIASLVVPFAAITLVLALDEDERRRLPGLLLGVVVIGMFVGLLQFSGVGIDNPFVNDTPGQVSGTFANRNHFGLLLGIGCLLAPVWGFLREQDAHWRAPVAGGLALLFLLTILASGSRAGLALGLTALVLGLVMSRQAMRKAVARFPRWIFPALVAGIVGLAVIFVLLSVMMDRAVSINRLFAADFGQDMRGRGFPVVLTMIGEYFPFGTGLGGFDPMFRLHEPLELLKPTIFNHAHNDFLEVTLDSGLPGLLLVAAALGWWAWASMHVWRGGARRPHALPRLGSAILFLVTLASIVDFPVRAPMIMAVVAIAAVWLSDGSQEANTSALPRSA